MSTTIDKVYVENDKIIAANVTHTETWNEVDYSFSSVLKTINPVDFVDAASVDVEALLVNIDTSPLVRVILEKISGVSLMGLDTTTEHTL